MDFKFLIERERFVPCEMPDSFKGNNDSVLSIEILGEWAWKGMLTWKDSIITLTEKCFKKGSCLDDTLGFELYFSIAVGCLGEAELKKRLALLSDSAEKKDK